MSNDMTFSSVDCIIPQALGGSVAEKAYFRAANGISDGIVAAHGNATNSLPNITQSGIGAAHS